MPAGFHSEEVEVTDDHGVLVTTLSKAPRGDHEFYLMLQHKDKYDKQDVKFGMNKPYIEYCGQGWSWYGHILSFRLLRDRVIVRMDEEASAHMSNDGSIEVTFKLGEAEFQQLRAAVRSTFNGQPYFTDEA